MAEQREEIGILLVHGMGEQKQREHLRGSARELASFVVAAPGLVRVSVVDESESSDGSSSTPSGFAAAPRCGRASTFRRPGGRISASAAGHGSR
jgi:hypothetical protein